MKTRLKKMVQSPFVPAQFNPSRTMHWLGGVTANAYHEIIAELKTLLVQAPSEPVTLVVTSPGGQTGIAMSFYDVIRTVYAPKLQTIGAGDVDSSGVIVFLAGSTRFITPNTTMLLHLAGRSFDTSRRFTANDMESMAREDSLKDEQYAAVLAERSGKLTAVEVLELMQRNTILSAPEAVELGLAHHIL